MTFEQHLEFGFDCANSGDLEGARWHFAAAERDCSTLPNQQQGTVLQMIANAEQSVGILDGAESHARAAVATLTPGTFVHAVCSQTLASILLDLGQPAEAFQLLTDALTTILETVPAQHQAANSCLVDYGRACAAVNDHEQARKAIKTALPHVADDVAAEANAVLASCATARGRFGSARHYRAQAARAGQRGGTFGSGR